MVLEFFSLYKYLYILLITMIWARILKFYHQGKEFYD